MGLMGAKKFKKEEIETVGMIELPGGKLAHFTIVKPKKYLKGQFTPINLMFSFFALVMLMILMPVLNTFIESTITSLIAGGVPPTDVIMTVLRMIPFFLLLAVILSTLIIAIPRREGQYG